MDKIMQVICPSAGNCTSVLEIFQSPDTRCAAIIIAVASFLVGVLLTCIICRMRRCSCASQRNTPMQKTHVRTVVKGGFEKKHPAPADGSIEIYVGNLSYDLTEDLLRKEFEAYGKVNSARIITNRYNGHSKGFGFVHMPNQAEATAAVKALNDKDILGRKLKCNEAKNVI